MMPEISVIVPVYNVEKYVGRCIDSILNQTFTDFELILVNDGSTDNSGVLCDKYAKSDDRIKVIHKKNGGVSSARNIGIDNAVGDYIMFVDSDDYIDKKMLEDMIKYRDSDIIISGLKYLDVNCNMICDNNYLQFTDITLELFLKEHYINMDEKYILSGPCNKLFKQSVLTKFVIRFNENISIFEDGLFVNEFLIKCKSITNINRSYYNYIQYSDNNLMTKYNDNAVEASIMHYKKRNELTSGFLELTTYIEQKEINAICSCISQIYTRSNLRNIEKYRKLKQILKNSLVKDLLLKNGALNYRVRILSFIERVQCFLVLHIMYTIRWIGNKEKR